MWKSFVFVGSENTILEIFSIFWSTLKTFKAPFYRIFLGSFNNANHLFASAYIEVRSTAPTAPFSRAMGGHSIGVRKLLLGNMGSLNCSTTAFQRCSQLQARNLRKQNVSEASRRCFDVPHAAFWHANLQQDPVPFYRGPIFVSTRVMPFYGRPTFVSTCVVPFYRQPCCRSWGWSPSWQSQGNHPWRGGRTAR